MSRSSDQPSLFDARPAPRVARPSATTAIGSAFDVFVYRGHYLTDALLGPAADTAHALELLRGELGDGVELSPDRSWPGEPQVAQFTVVRSGSAVGYVAPRGLLQPVGG